MPTACNCKSVRVRQLLPELGSAKSEEIVLLPVIEPRTDLWNNNLDFSDLKWLANCFRHGTPSSGLVAAPFVTQDVQVHTGVCETAPTAAQHTPGNFANPTGCFQIHILK